MIVTAPDHTKRVFDNYEMPKLARWAEEQVLDLKADGIVCCGHSGLVLAGAVSLLTRLPVVAVRKEGESTVASADPVSAVLRNGPLQRWVWLDDLLASGGTLVRSVTTAHKHGLLDTVWPAGLLLYNSYGTDGDDTWAFYNEKKADLAKSLWGTDVPTFTFRHGKSF